MTALLLVRVSLLLAVALTAGRLFRRTSGRTRHALWTAAFAAMLVLPALPYLLPAVEVPVPEGWRPAPIATSPRWQVMAGSSTLQPAGTETASAREHAVIAPVATTTTSSFSHSGSRLANLQPRALLIAAWAIGTCVALALLGVSLVRVRALDRSATDWTDQEWQLAAAAIAGRAGAVVRLRLSDHVHTPMAGGVLRPTIYLPAAAATWPAERRDIVLAHELAHLAHRDPLRHVAARVAVAVYWFHPLAWMAAARASAAREQACDEAVLALGTRPSSYAQVLLDFASAQATPLPALAALPIVDRSLLEQRVMTILAHDPRVARRRRSLFAVTALAVLAVTIGTARPAARQAPLPSLDIPHLSSSAFDIRQSSSSAFGLRPSALTATATETPAAQRALDCDVLSPSGFRGSMSSSDRAGERVVYDMIGTAGSNRVIMKSLADLRVCMIAEDAAGDDDAVPPSEWPQRARRTLIEARKGNRIQRLELTREGAGQRVSWTIDGKEQPFDTAAQDWRERMLAVLDTSWEISTIRGEVSTLRGEISSLRGQESSLRGEISSLRGDVSSLRGQISSVHGDESSLRGEISSIQGYVSSLQGLISSEQGSISSLNASRSFAGEAERARIVARIREHEAEIARVEKAIRDYAADEKIAEVERRLRDLEVQKTVAAIESQIRSLNTEGKVAEIEKRIRDLDVEGKTGAIEGQIDAVNADTRIRALETRRDQELKDLLAAIARIR